MGVQEDADRRALAALDRALLEPDSDPLPQAVLAEAEELVAAETRIVVAFGDVTTYWSAPAGGLESRGRHVLVGSFPLPDGRMACLALARTEPRFTGRDVAAVRAFCARLGSLTRFGDLGRRSSPDLPLTPCERRVLACVAAGLTDRATARRLGVAEATVRKHLEHIYRKLEVSNRVAASVRWLAANT